MAAAMSRRLLQVVAAVVLMAGRGARLEARHPAAAAVGAARPSSLVPTPGGESVALPSSPPDFAVPRRRAAWRSWLPSAALLLGGAGDMARAADPDMNSAKSVAETFAGLDVNGDKFVSVDEFLGQTRVSLEKNGASPENVEQFLKVYRRLHAASDIDGDGQWNEQELEYSHHLAAEASRRRRNQMGAIVERARATAASGSKETWQELAEKDMQEHDKNEDFASEAAEKRFGLMDQDSNGRVTKDEFWEIIGQSTVALGWQERRHENADVREWMEDIWTRADVSGDGEWDEKECDYGMHLIMKEVEERASASKLLLETMLILDENGDDRIDKDEVAAGLRRVQEEALEDDDDVMLKMQQIRFYFDTADEDEDGTLDRSEANKLAERIIHEL